jgi:twitching motility protein PilU
MSAGNMEKVLRLMADKNASDVYLSANTPILIRINGQILQLSDQVLSPAQMRHARCAEVAHGCSTWKSYDRHGRAQHGASPCPVSGSFRISRPSVSAARWRR